MKNVKAESRRSFMKTLALAIAGAPLLGASLSGISRLAKAADADLPPIKEGEGMAATLKYCANAEKGKAKVCTTRKEKGREKQYCSGCQLYTNIKGEGKAARGKCLLMPQGLVSSQGWCNSWVQKPGT